MPPCNCHPPFPRPEPFSPLPRPGKTPDWGKWIRDRLAEKGALLVFPTRASFPSPGAWPNLYLDQETGAVYRWDREDYAVLFGPREGNDVLVYDSVAAFPDEGEQGKLYIAANTGSLYRWGGEGYVALLPGKADKVVPAAEGNLAELTQDGNLADSGKKPADFADAENTYTKAETDEAIDRVAAYYITRNAAGDAFETKAQLNSATVFYSGGKVRTPTRNDYCVVLADETHDNAEYRYIYAVADGETTGSWQPQFPVEGVMTIDQTVTKNSQNPVSGGGVWSMLWGALAALPTGFTSLYDWCVEQLAGKATKADATLTEKWTPTFSLTDEQKEAFSQTPGASDNDYALTIVPSSNTESYLLYVGSYNAAAFRKDPSNSTNLIFEGGDARLGLQPDDIVATLSGYQLGSQSDKPLASEAEAEALRTGKQDALSAQQLANIAAVPNKANRAPNPTAGNLAALDANGNPTNSTIPAANVATKGNIPYDLVAKTIGNGAVTLDDRAINAVAVSSSLASLTVNFPTATSGKARDFGLRLTVASGITTAPQIVLPQGVTCENADGEAPEIGADGAATILYFTETAAGVFLVKGEVLQTITA